MSVQEKAEIIKENRPENRNGLPLSDDVIIEVVHAFKDIIIEFINRRYATTTEK